MSGRALSFVVLSVHCSKPNPNTRGTRNTRHRVALEHHTVSTQGVQHGQLESHVSLYSIARI